MIEAPSLALAFAAGVVSFLSPCCLPLVPGYLAAVSGTPAERLADAGTRRVVWRAGLFVATFSLIFVLLGLGATVAGAFLFANQETLNAVAGTAIVALGLLFVASAVVPRLNREWRVDALMDRAGSGGPVVAGAAFALAWTPCVGPTLGAILSLAATSSGTGRGGLLLAVYAAGLGVPFVVAALAFNATTRAFAVIKRHFAVIQAVSGAVLIAMGVLVLTGELFRLNVEAQALLDRYGLNLFKSF